MKATNSENPFNPSAGVNPRKAYSNHRERGPKKHTYTITDVSKLTGMTALALQGDKDLKLSDLLSVSVRVFKSLVKRSRVLTDEELREYWGPRYEKWEGRHPKVDLYRCGYPGCTSVRLGQGLCESHGGEKIPVVDFGEKESAFNVRVGERWVPWHRLVVPKTNESYFHRDGNSWNNAPSNLQTAAEKYNKPIGKRRGHFETKSRYWTAPAFCLEPGTNNLTRHPTSRAGRVRELLRSQPDKLWSTEEICEITGYSRLVVDNIGIGLMGYRHALQYSSDDASMLRDFPRQLEHARTRHDFQFMAQLPIHILTHYPALWPRVLEEWVLLFCRTLSYGMFAAGVELLDPSLENTRLAWRRASPELPSWEGFRFPWQTDGTAWEAPGWPEL